MLPLGLPNSIELIEQLNAMSTSSNVDEYDFNTRMIAFQKFKTCEDNNMKKMNDDEPVALQHFGAEDEQPRRPRQSRLQVLEDAVLNPHARMSPSVADRVPSELDGDPLDVKDVKLLC